MRPVMTASTPARRWALLVVVLACGCHPSAGGEPVAPTQGAKEREPLREPETEDVPAPATGEAAEHITFDAGDAGAVPAEGVVAQPQREPLPSLMSEVLYGPSR